MLDRTLHALTAAFNNNINLCSPSHYSAGGHVKDSFVSDRFQLNNKSLLPSVIAREWLIIVPNAIGRNFLSLIPFSSHMVSGLMTVLFQEIKFTFTMHSTVMRSNILARVFGFPMHTPVWLKICDIVVVITSDSTCSACQVLIFCYEPSRRSSPASLFDIHSAYDVYHRFKLAVISQCCYCYYHFQGVPQFQIHPRPSCWLRFQDCYVIPIWWCECPYRAPFGIYIQWIIV